MSAIAWPFATGLASRFQFEGLNYVPALPVNHSQAGSGPVLSNQIDDIMFKTWSGNVKFETADLITFENIWLPSIGYGATAFTWIDPLTGEDKLWKLIAYSDGRKIAPAYWEISITIQEMPEPEEDE